MKAKNILMSILLVMGSIAAKAATGYPPELALVSQPVMVYNYNTITVYYDVQNIGDHTYRGYVYLYLDPDNGYYYADKYVKVCPGRIKRIAIDIPAYRPNPSRTYTIMPYYELGDELYSFTTFEYFEPLCFYWDGPRTERFVVTYAPPRPRHYVRPGEYRYYYDGFRPPVPPPTAGFGPAIPPPMNPMHHTYSYHNSNGGYPATHNVTPPAPANNGNEAPHATVRPKPNSGSMSSGNGNANANSGINPPAPSSNSVAPSHNSGASTGTSTTGPTGTSSGRTGSGNVSRPNNSGASTGTSTTGATGTSSGRTGNGNVSRPNNSGASAGTSTTGTSSRKSGSSNTRNDSNTGGTSTRSGSSSGRGGR